MSTSDLERIRTGPLLGDGMSPVELFDDHRREVALRALSDPDLYELELEHLFGKAWIALGHISELSSPDSFVTRWIGEDPVIVSRSSDGEVHVMLNACTHRGMALCRTDRGSGTQFRCPYHGWVFGNEGRFLAAPFEKEMYGTMDKPARALKQARTGVYAGVIFATWDPDAPELVDYLGDIAWYLDIMLSRTDAGFEVVGIPQRFTINTNWKAASEQWAGDGYHAMTLHESLVHLGMGDWSKGSWAISVSHEGHLVRCSQNPKKFWGGDTDGAPLVDQLRALPPPGTTPDMLDQVMHHMSEGQLKVMVETPPSIAQVFPNLFVWNTHGRTAEGELSAITRIHTTVPKGPDRIEFFSWALVERDAPPEVRAAARATSVLMTGISGFIEQDDAEAWPSITRTARGFMGRRQTLKYAAVLGEQRPEDWPGGGTVYDGFSRDDPQWNWWLRYREFMTGTAW